MAQPKFTDDFKIDAIRQITERGYSVADVSERLGVSNARYDMGAMILTSNRGFAEWGEVFGDPIVATAFLDRLLHHAVVIQIEGASYRLRHQTDLIPEHIRANVPISPPPPPKQRGPPVKQEAIIKP